MNKNQILLQRTITGLIFGAVVLGLLYSGKMGTIGLFLIVAGLSSYEYTRMIFPKERQKIIFAILVTYLVIYLSFHILPLTQAFHTLTILACLGMVLGIINMFRPFIDHRKYYLLINAMYFGLTFGLFISYIYNAQTYPHYLIFSIIIFIWLSDSFAYLVGSRIGKNKQFPSISPKKTWEGFIGGGTAAIAGAVIISSYNHEYSTLFWVSTSIIIWVIGTFGDLVESSIKRQFDIKDSGTILPGHGGILDRFDSFIYILPFILLLLLHF